MLAVADGRKALYLHAVKSEDRLGVARSERFEGRDGVKNIQRYMRGIDFEIYILNRKRHLGIKRIFRYLRAQLFDILRHERETRRLSVTAKMGQQML